MRSTTSFNSSGISREALFGFRRAFSNLEDFVFGFVQKLACVAPRIVGAAERFGTNFGKLAHDRAFAHDFCSNGGYWRRKGVLCQ